MTEGKGNGITQGIIGGVKMKVILIIIGRVSPKITQPIREETKYRAI